MRSDYRFWILAGSSALVFTTVDAQDPNYFRLPRAKPSLGEVQIGGKFLLGPSVNFSGMGTIGIYPPGQLVNPEDYQSDLAPALNLIYIDGSVGQDYIVEDSIKHRTTDGKTGNFSYFSADQVQEKGGDKYLAFHTLSAVGTGDIYEGDTGNGGGIEVAYRRYISPKKRLGLDFAISFAGFESNLNQTVGAQFDGKTFYHLISGSNFPKPDDLDSDGELDPSEDTDSDGVLDDGEDTNGNGQLDIEDRNSNDELDPYEGDDVRNQDVNSDGTTGDVETDLVDVIPTNPDTKAPVTTNDPTKLEKLGEDMSDDQIADFDASVSGDMRFRTTAATFRFGPAYNLPVTKSFSMAFSAGVTSSYYTGRLSGIQYLTVGKLADSIVASEFVEGSRSRVIVGGYVESSAALQINDRVNMFTGVQYQSSSGYEMQAGDYQVDVDLSSQIYVKTGFGVAF